MTSELTIIRQHSLIAAHISERSLYGVVSALAFPGQFHERSV
jgi:hypothetical protein